MNQYKIDKKELTKWIEENIPEELEADSKIVAIYIIRDKIVNFLWDLIQ